MQQKIVITGGPGTGKSSLIHELMKRNYECMPEISRQVTLEAQQAGVKQLFLKDPLQFSGLLLKGREQQFLTAESKAAELVFFDRGIPDVHAYMNYLGVKYPAIYIEKSLECRYTTIFMTPPWQEIYESDNERYESYEQSLAIHNHLKETYRELDYVISDVPVDAVEKRVDFILNELNI